MVSTYITNHSSQCKYLYYKNKKNKNGPRLNPNCVRSSISHVILTLYKKSSSNRKTISAQTLYFVLDWPFIEIVI